MFIVAIKSQIKVLKILVKLSKDSIPYSPSISIFLGKLLFQGEFVDFQIGTGQSQTKVFTILVKLSKDSVLYNPSRSTFLRKLLLEDGFVDLRTGAKNSQIKA